MMKASACILWKMLTDRIILSMSLWHISSPPLSRTYFCMLWKVFNLRYYLERWRIQNLSSTPNLSHLTPVAHSLIYRPLYQPPSLHQSAFPCIRSIAHLVLASRNVQDGKYLGLIRLHGTKCVLCISFSTTFPISSCVSFSHLSFGPLQNSFIIKFISS